MGSDEYIKNLLSNFLNKRIVNFLDLINDISHWLVPFQKELVMMILQKISPKTFDDIFEECFYMSLQLVLSTFCYFLVLFLLFN